MIRNVFENGRGFVLTFFKGVLLSKLGYYGVDSRGIFKIALIDCFKFKKHM